MSKIKIAFIETNAKNNGPIQQTYNIIRHMDRDKFEPALITMWPEEEGNSLLENYEKLDIPIYCCNLSKKTSIFFGKKRVSEFLEELKPDIVQGVGMPPYRMSLSYKKAVHLVTLRNYCLEDYPSHYGKFLGWILAYMDLHLIRKQLKKGEPFLTCSESLQVMYKELQNISIPFIRNGVDVDKYTQRKLDEVPVLRTKLGLPGDKFIYVYSGGLIERKNQKEAIEAFLKMQKGNDAVLLLLGDGADRAGLEAQYGHHTNILFKGKVSNVSEYLQASDVYLATSKSEGLPNGVLEAMATGIPVLLSNIPQHLEVLEPNKLAGHSYQLGDVDELAGLMDAMMEEDLVMRGINSYNSVQENFTARGMSTNYQKFYQDRLMGEK